MYDKMYNFQQLCSKGNMTEQPTNQPPDEHDEG